MEAVGSPVAFAVGAAEAPELARLFERSGPFVAVHLTTEQKLDNAAQRSVQHWRPVRDLLDRQGVDDRTIEAIEAIVPELHHEGPGVFVLAAAGEVVLTIGLDEAPARDRASVGALPPIAPLIEWRQLHQPHVIVLADRSGADIIAVGPRGDERVDSAGGNDGGDPHLRKSNPGGWSQRRYQERAENRWEANAKAVAERVHQIATLIDPAAILVAGDVRALQHLQEELDERLAPRVRELDGSRHADSGDDVLLDDARRQLKTVAAADTVAILQKFKEEKGQGDRAAEGLAATIEALNAARVETLLVHDDLDDDRRLWFAPDGPLVATDRAVLEGYGVADPQEGRLVDALIRAAFGSGARVRIVPTTVVEGGVAAILRYSD